MMDITAQKEAELALQFANDELEFRVLARTSELAEANEMMSLEIGERMRAEKLTREAEERYRLLVERLPAVLYIWDVSERGDLSDALHQPDDRTADRVHARRMALARPTSGPSASTRTTAPG